MKLPTKPNAPSLNPPSDYLYGLPGRRVFLQDLSVICAQAVAQSCPTHPMHERVTEFAEDSRSGFKPRLAAQEAAEQRAIKAA